jgi:hypothetical protein
MINQNWGNGGWLSFKKEEERRETADTSFTISDDVSNKSNIAIFLALRIS